MAIKTRLVTELEKDPSAIFEFETKLPSGNTMYGTVGPLVNSRVAAHIEYEAEPTEADIEYSKQAMNHIMGTQPAVALVSKDRDAAQSTMRRFLGGGVG